MRLPALASALAIVCFSWACAKKAPELPPVSDSDCQRLSVILPGNFIIDIMAGSEVELNPHKQEFALFCSPEEAKSALDLAWKEKRLPEGSDWKIYYVSGKASELAAPGDDGGLRLKKGAFVSDWADEKSLNHAF